MDHKGQLHRLNRIEGQVRGIHKMVEEGRYCIDILSQVRAARSALHKVELGILEDHIQGCVKSALESKNKEDVDIKVKELMRLITKLPE